MTMAGSQDLTGRPRPPYSPAPKGPAVSPWSGFSPPAPNPAAQSSAPAVGAAEWIMSEKLKQIGRLALRHEGNWWNAYYAKMDTMDGAVLLGTISMAVVQNPKRKDAFMALMREAVADILEEVVGVRPSWPDGPCSAPEHEKAGHS